VAERTAARPVAVRTKARTSAAVAMTVPGRPISSKLPRVVGRRPCTHPRPGRSA
jgi:hypothetical protein